MKFLILLPLLLSSCYSFAGPPIIWGGGADTSKLLTTNLVNSAGTSFNLGVQATLTGASGETLVNTTDDTWNFLSNDETMTIQATGFEAKDAVLRLCADDGDNTSDCWKFTSDAVSNNLTLANGVTDFIVVSTNGDVSFAGVTPYVTIGDGGNEDNGVVLSGQDFVYNFSNDESINKAVIGVGSSAGTDDAIRVVGSNAAVEIRGTNTTGDAAAGFVGEYIESVVSANTNFPATTQYGDLTSISLTAGDWDVTACIDANANGATVLQIIFGISATSGNDATGLVMGDTAITTHAPNGTTDAGYCLSGVRITLTATTTHYFKFRSTYSVATPRANGRISARRVR